MSEKHIRDGLISTIAATLETITKANGYSRNVSRVYQTPPNATNIPTPAIVITQGNEDVVGFVGPISERNVILNITFVDNYAGDDSDGEALEFLVDVQRALGTILTFQFTAKTMAGADHTSNAQLYEEGSSLNYAEPMRGKIYGTTTYNLQYRTAAKDPRRLP